MKKPIFFLCIIAVFALPFQAVPQEPPAHHRMLADLIRRALADNPRLEAAARSALAAEKTIPQAGALPDPQFSVSFSNLPVDSFTFDRDMMTGKVFGVMQMFPFPGKRVLSTEMAEFEAEAVAFQRREIQGQVIQMVKHAYYDLYTADRALETIEQNRALMEQFVRIAETKYATGSGLQQDVLRSQVEVSKLEDDLISWQQRRRSTKARLNALLNRPAVTFIPPTIPGLTLPENHATAAFPEEMELKRPLLKAWNQRLLKMETAVKLAERDIWPDFSISANYRQRNNLENGIKLRDFFSAAVSLNVPLFYKRKQKAKAAEKELAHQAARAEYENIKNTVRANAESLLSELERHHRRIELYRDGILLQARQSLESARAGYRVGKVDFLTLINNQMMLQNYELQIVFATTGYYKALASYQLTVGENTFPETEPEMSAGNKKPGSGQ